MIERLFHDLCEVLLFALPNMLNDYNISFTHRKIILAKCGLNIKVHFIAYLRLYT